jgi:hypothetical protein
MTTTSSLKSTSLAELQETFSQALSERAGFKCKVVINELRFETNGARAWLGTESAAFSGQIEIERDYSEPWSEEAKASAKA